MRFTCTHCGKAYARTEHLKRHIQSTHQSDRADEAPRIYPCDAPGCEKTFRRSDVLARHKRGHASSEDAAPNPTKRIKRSSTSSPSDFAHRSTSSRASILHSAAQRVNDPSNSHDGLHSMMDYPQAGPSFSPSHASRHSLSEASPAGPTPPEATNPVQSLVGTLPNHVLSGSAYAHSHASALPTQPTMDDSFRPQHTGQPLTTRALQEQQQLASLEYSLSRSADAHTNANGKGNVGTADASQALPMRSHTETNFSMQALTGMPNAYPEFPASPRPSLAPARPRPPADFGFSFDEWDPQLFDQEQNGGDAAGIPRLGWDSLNYKNLTGLDWIFEDGAASLTDASVFSGVLPSSFDDELAALEDFGPQPPDSLSRATEKIFERAKGPEGASDPFESLNLINLANTAIDQASGNNNSALANGGRTARNPDDDGEWPQDYRPTRRQPPTFDISDLILAVEMNDEAQDDSASRNARTSEPYSEPVSSRHIPFVLIEESLEDSADGRRTTGRNSPIQKAAPTKPFGSTGKITETARQHLLEYIRHSCKHPWSVYSFNGNADKFLTCSEIEILVSLYFRKVHPYTPILHQPSFDPETTSPVLLLIMVTKGLVFYVSEMQARGARSASLARLHKRASILAPALSELTRIGTMSAYEADQRGFQDIVINSAWLLQQQFGIGAGNKRLYKLAERNRGGIMTAIRRIGLLNMSTIRLDTTDQPLDTIDDQKLERKWRAWIERESRIRLGWCVFLYDQLYSLYMDISPVLLYTEITSPFPCDEQLWNARSAREWFSRIPQHSQATPKTSFIDALRKLLDPPRHEDIPLRLNRFEAYILAVTLYRIRWDTSKRSVLFGMEAFAHAEEVTLGENHVVDAASGTVAIDAAAANALQGLAEAAASATLSLTSKSPAKRSKSSANPPNLALSVDVQLLRLLSRMHFSGPPAFFDRLKDAAGRAGNARRADAVVELKRWVADPKNHVAMRQMLLASAQVYDLIRTSLDAAAANSNVMVLQSHVGIVGLFHSALIVWAYVKFGPIAQRRLPVHGTLGHALNAEGPTSTLNGKGDEVIRASKSQLEALPYLSPAALRLVEEAGFIDLIAASGDVTKSADGTEDWQERASDSTNESGSLSVGTCASDSSTISRVVEAWSLGAYRSTVDGQPRRWSAANNLVVRIAGIGELKAGDGVGIYKQGMQNGGASTHQTASRNSYDEDLRERTSEEEGERRNIDKSISSTRPVPPQMNGAFTPRGHEGLPPGTPTVNLDEGQEMKTSRILIRFATLLRKLDWGLAASFRTILIHMARHEARAVEAAEALPEANGESRQMAS
ncbi:hypothetical protein PANT_22c00004 [Moesziomyces antarcticus T-34]|uniref:C2H2-type domain-containing protein n=1 Tax=Pseudozyma antarctica (strain T-34) TaxID=1151754 RepID=M9MHT8_PSEA3|nr:hypothetical protein PANT_22c00004 [Moesziomyces antarcticus T-34]